MNCLDIKLQTSKKKLVINIVESRIVPTIYTLHYHNLHQDYCLHCHLLRKFQDL